MNTKMARPGCAVSLLTFSINQEYIMFDLGPWHIEMVNIYLFVTHLYGLTECRSSVGSLFASYASSS